MKTLGILLSLVFVIACSEPVKATGEPPFFKADRNANGPLTLAELQIHLPNEIDRSLNDSERSCFLQR